MPWERSVWEFRGQESWRWSSQKPSRDFLTYVSSTVNMSTWIYISSLPRSREPTNWEAEKGWRELDQPHVPGLSSSRIPSCFGGLDSIVTSSQRPSLYALCYPMAHLLISQHLLPPGISLPRILSLCILFVSPAKTPKAWELKVSYSLYIIGPH